VVTADTSTGPGLIAKSYRLSSKKDQAGEPAVLYRGVQTSLLRINNAAAEALPSPLPNLGADDFCTAAADTVEYRVNVVSPM
jgi:hypothetical protein